MVSSAIASPLRFFCETKAATPFSKAVHSCRSGKSGLTIKPIMFCMTIGELAKSADVPTSTVRFYERRGLLEPDARTRSNYRTYSPSTVERLKFIRSAQAAGFSLKDVREMLDLTYSDEPPCDEVAALIERRLDDVKQR